jgi:ribosomal protein S18 acetylase RimI-like enzyme
MIIRDMTLADVPPVAAMHVAAWRAAYRGIMSQDVLDGLSVDERGEVWRRSLGDSRRKNVLCELDGQVVGFISWGPSRDADAGPTTAELYAAYVHPEYWRRGIGTAMWHEADAHATGRYSDMTLWVLAENRSARRFYERIGFLEEPGAEKLLRWHVPSLVEVRYRRPVAPAPQTTALGT